MLDPFVRQGIERGDRLVYIVDPAKSAEPVNRLRHLGYDAAPCSSSIAAKSTRGPTPI